jgi:hypothetical protein
VQKVETTHVLFLRIKSTSPVCKISECGAWGERKDKVRRHLYGQFGPFEAITVSRSDRASTDLGTGRVRHDRKRQHAG